MALFEWEPRYSVHVTEFDNHHKKLIELLQKLHQSMLDGQGKSIVGGILDELKEYTVYHFSAEESLMEKHKYPEYEAHKAKHKELIQQLNELIASYKTGKSQITTETYKFLNKWLTNHIMNADKRYTSFFKDKGL
jgi:hemerythrin-like metal-binding protein